MATFKLCSRCKLMLTSKSFGTIKRTGRLRARCLVCEAMPASTEPSKVAARFLARNTRKGTRDKFRSWLATQACIDCGESEPVVLELDHVRGVKTANVSDMVRAGRNWPLVAEEIAKCDVRCANCHRIETHRRRIDGFLPNAEWFGPQTQAVALRREPHSNLGRVYRCGKCGCFGHNARTCNSIPHPSLDIGTVTSEATGNCAA